MLPLFKSHFSFGKSILNLSKDKDEDNLPNSIINIALERDMKEIFLVEDSMSGFLDAYNNCKDKKLKLRFGLRLVCIDNINQKDDESRNNECKFIILMKNTDGYKDLIKIYSKAATEGFYYYPRIDYKSLREMWTQNLSLAIPYYDSFLHVNTLTFGMCIPDYSFTEPVIFQESNNLPFNYLLDDAIKAYNKDKGHKIIKAKSIFYKNKKDFKAYLTNRCIHNRTTLNKPNLEHLSSDEFCIECI